MLVGVSRKQEEDRMNLMSSRVGVLVCVLKVESHNNTHKKVFKLAQLDIMLYHIV